MDPGVGEYGVEARVGLGTRILRRLKGAVLPVMFLAVSAYFMWHSVHGERGLLAKEARLQQIAEAKAERDRVQAELTILERRVQGLRGDRLDRDLLDERARQQWGMMGKDEVVIPYGPERRLF
jgi:cell division protein FtsB